MHGLLTVAGALPEEPIMGVKTGREWPAGRAIALVGMFAVFHGYAHGVKARGIKHAFLWLGLCSRDGAPAWGGIVAGLALAIL
jgi:hydrogenase/urease accessory protein HupE